MDTRRHQTIGSIIHPRQRTAAVIPLHTTAEAATIPRRTDGAVIPVSHQMVGTTYLQYSPLQNGRDSMIDVLRRRSMIVGDLKTRDVSTTDRHTTIDAMTDGIRHRTGATFTQTSLHPQ